MHPPPSPLHVQLAARALQSGGVIACATEAVWGLSCDPANEDAVQQLLALKRRPVAKGLILVAAAQSQLEFLLDDLGPEQRRTLADSWPGPTTWLVPHRSRIPQWICGTHHRVAVRVSDHPAVRTLCAAWGGPLVSTSANPAGARPATEAFQVFRYFGKDVDYLLPGRVGSAARPSSIRDLGTGQIIRA